MNDPFTLTISPASVLVTHRAHFSETVRLTNGGTQALAVHAAPEQLLTSGAHCVLSGSAANWAAIKPSAFALAPGAHREVTFTVNAPAGTTGTHDVVAVFTGLGPAASGSGRIAGAIGSQVVMALNGKTAGRTCLTGHAAPKLAPRPPAAGSGSPGTALLGLAVVLALVAMAVWAVIALRRRHARR